MPQLEIEHVVTRYYFTNIKSSMAGHWLPSTRSGFLTANKSICRSFFDSSLSTGSVGDFAPKWVDGIGEYALHFAVSVETSIKPCPSAIMSTAVLDKLGQQQDLFLALRIGLCRFRG